jgi:hypothetical protein
MKRHFTQSYPLDPPYWLFCILLFVLVSCKKQDAEIQPIVFKATGYINDEMNNFSSRLGNLNNTPGATSGRREINWDGVPDNLIGLAFPTDFFNPTDASAPAARQKGLIYANNSGQFQVSKNNFSNTNPASTGEFAAFSGTNTFANVTANEWPVNFQVAGKTTEAYTKGFGVVFSDVDLPNSTSLEFFEGAKSLGKFYAPPHSLTSSFSFLGVYFPGNEHVTKVVVKHDGIMSDGQRDISAGGQHDLVIFDDFIYGEPQKQ